MSDEETPADKAGRKAGTKPGVFVPGDKRINRTRPGPGRPPDVIRAALRVAFWKHRAQLEKFAKSSDAAVAMKAMELMAKYGMGTTFTPTDDKGKTLNSVNVTHQIVDAS